MALQLIPLHKRLDLIQPCISLLSNEWPSGKYDRLEMLEVSCPNPPCSLVLLSNQDGDQDLVIGHCRIVPVKKPDDDMLFVEQVVIDKSRRGRGLGARLLKMLEEYCVKQGFRKLYLGTSPDTPRLYLRVGYRFTDFRPTMIGSGMLDHTIQLPLNEPCPGWEQFYTPYDGRILSSKAPIYNESSSHHTTAEGERGSTKDEQGRDQVKVPSWALDIDGYCCLQKDITLE